MFKSILKSELLRNTSILISGTAFAQIIPIFLQPVLRRYFSPQIFGAYSVYLSLIGILVIISSFKYELATVLPKKDKDAISIFFLSVFINIIFSLILLVVIIIWAEEILSFLNISAVYSEYLYFVPFGTFLYSVNQSINYWLIRKKRFFPITLNKFIRRGFEGSAQVVFKFAEISNGLIYGDIIGHTANICSGIFQSWKSGLSIKLVSLKKIKYVFIKYAEYPKYNVIPSLMSACSFLLPTILINKYFSSENTGFFDLSKLLLSVPLALIATSISNVLLQRISEKFRNKESFIKDLVPIFLIVILVVAIELFLIVFFGVDLFKLIFGELWIFSGSISKILVWSYVMNFIVASFSSIFISMNKIKILSIWQLFYFSAILLLILFRNSTFIGFLKIYVLIEVFCYLVVLFLMVWIVLSYEKKIKLCVT